MRLKPEVVLFIKMLIFNTLPESKLYLFGSRAIDTKKGGDIDLLLITENKIPMATILAIKIELYKKIGWQKIDIINFTREEKSNFKEIILSQSIEL